MEDFEKILEESKTKSVVLCKLSPICHISSEVEYQLSEYLPTASENISFYQIDVVRSRDTSRGLAKLINVKHESPQILLFKNKQCVWHESHYRLTKEVFQENIK